MYIMTSPSFSLMRQFGIFEYAIRVLQGNPPQTSSTGRDPQLIRVPRADPWVSQDSAQVGKTYGEFESVSLRVIEKALIILGNHLSKIQSADIDKRSC